MSSAFFDHLDQYKPDGGQVSSSGGNDIDDIFSALIGTEASVPDATSPKGARGTAQITPDTFKQYALKGENYNNEVDRVKAARRKVEDDYSWASGLTDDPEHAKKLTAAAYFGGRGGAMLWAQGKGSSRSDGILDLNGYVDRFTNKIGSRVDAALNPGMVSVKAETLPAQQDLGVDMSQWNVGRTDEPMRASDYGNILSAGQVSAQEQSDAAPWKTSAVRGWESMTTGLGLWKDALIGDHESMAGRIKEYAKFDAANPMPGSAAKFNSDWRAEEYAKALLNIPGFAMANVEQLANMVPSMVGGIPGAVKGAAVGSGYGPVGTFIGGVLGFGAGSAPGTIAVEGGMHVLEKMTKDGVNPDNPAAVKAWLTGNRDALIEYGLIKGGTVAAFDTVSAALGGAVVARPAMALAIGERNVLRSMGVDLANPQAVAAATKAPPYRAAMAPLLAEYQASATTAGNVMRGAAAMGSEFAGEFGGEYVGTGLAGGGWNANEALLEGAMALGTSAVTTAGEFALANAVRKPNSPLTNAANAAGGTNAQTQQVPPGAPPPGTQVPMGGQGAAQASGSSPVQTAVPPIDPLAARNDAEIARFTQEMADAEARSEKLNSRALENVPDEHLTNVADSFAWKAQQGIPLTPEQQRVAESVALELEFRDLKKSEATAIASRPALPLGAVAINQQVQDGVPLDQVTATTPAAKARLKKPKKEAANGSATPAAPAAENAGLAAQGGQGQGDVLPRSSALAPTDGNVQPAPGRGRDIPAAVAAPSGGTAVPDGATGDGRSPVADENGFIAGPDNYRIRIGEHKAGSNFLDPQADAGALTYEVRKGNNDRSPLNMVVGKSGKLIEAEQALGLDQKSNGVAWIPPTPEAREKAIELLRKRAITKVGSNERKAIDAALTNVVTAPADKTEAAGEPRRGEVGGMVAAGEVVLTSSGRETTPFPAIKSGPRGTPATVKAVDGWLMQNALDEARARGDGFNARQFEQNLSKPSQADKGSAEEYLFGQQPTVPRPFLKPLPSNNGETLSDADLEAAFDAAATEVGAAQTSTPSEPVATPAKAVGVTLNDVPPKLMRNLKVPVERLVGNEIKTVEVSANEAIADLDEEIAAYEKLLACVKAAA